jgi:hypothetical protein
MYGHTTYVHCKANSVENPRFPRQQDNVDTIVDPAEFRVLLQTALDRLDLGAVTLES